MHGTIFPTSKFGFSLKEEREKIVSNEKDNEQEETEEKEQGKEGTNKERRSRGKRAIAREYVHAYA